MNPNPIQTLHAAARILGQHGRHTAAGECIAVASVLAVDQTFGDEPRPAPGKRLERLAPRRFGAV